MVFGLLSLVQDVVNHLRRLFSGQGLLGHLVPAGVALHNSLVLAELQGGFKALTRLLLCKDGKGGATSIPKKKM